MAYPKAYFFRHANAEKGATDRIRPLSELGRDQAVQRRNKLGSPRFEAVLSSPAVRAHQTAAIIANIEPTSVFTLETLYWEPGTEFGGTMDTMFNELKYAPLRAYRDHALGTWIMEHGVIAMQDSGRYMDDKRTEDPLTIASFGHAVLIPAMAYAIVSDSHPAPNDILDQILDVNLGEACGFVLTWNSETGELTFTLIND